MWEAFGARTHGRVVPARPVADRMQARVERGAAGVAHRHGQIRPIKNQSLACEVVDIGRFDILPAVQGQIVVGRIICDCDQDIRFHNPPFARPQADRQF